MKNLVINVMLRRVGRVWECRATCALHDSSGSSAKLDAKQEALKEALDSLPCGCYGG